MSSDAVKRVALWMVAAVCLSGASACTGQLESGVSETKLQRQQVPFASLAEVKSQVSSSSGPAIIEFAQDFNCSRCDEMVATMSDLRAGFAKDVAFHRVNYLAANNEIQLGVCPTYLLVLDGEVVDQLAGKQPYPILAARLDNLVANHKRKTNQHNDPTRTDYEHDTDY